LVRQPLASMPSAPSSPLNTGSRQPGDACCGSHVSRRACSARSTDAGGLFNALRPGTDPAVTACMSPNAAALEAVPFARSPAFETAPSIIGTGTALPSHHYTQSQLAEIALRTLPELSVQPKVVERFFGRVGVEGRYLALSADEYMHLSGFGAHNDAWIQAALDLGERAIVAALADARLHQEMSTLLCPLR